MPRRALHGFFAADSQRRHGRRDSRLARWTIGGWILRHGAPPFSLAGCAVWSTIGWHEVIGSEPGRRRGVGGGSPAVGDERDTPPQPLAGVAVALPAWRGWGPVAALSS